MRKKHYVIVKDSNCKDVFFEHPNFYKTFKIKPRNQVKYDGIIVNQLTMYDDHFIEKVLKKKIKRKLDQYLGYLIDFLDDTDSDSTTDLRHALNDLTRYKSIIYNKYRKFLEEKYIELLMKKISLLEYEVNHKLMYLESYNYYENYFNSNDYEYEQEKGKSR